MRVVRVHHDLELDPSLRIGLVPTMGALHEGHLSLIRTAAKECDQVVVSLFVNPTQFGPHEDYTRYPRVEEQDAVLARSAGANILFAPSVETVYPRRTTSVVPSGVALLWEGEKRPGHFDGVATVVCKLFNMVQPTVAYFGLKDYQQCQVIRQMVEDLNMTIELRFCDTVREEDGLAMSSRNVYLSSEERKVAPLLYKTLTDIAAAVAEKHHPDAYRELRLGRESIERAGFVIDYLEIVDAATMEQSSPAEGACRIIAAAWLGRTRLIDNVAV